MLGLHRIYNLVFILSLSITVYYYYLNYYYYFIDYNSAQFDGTKSIVISNAGIFGGKNLFLEVGYFVFGGICFLISIIFKIK
jgi:hypothetical protein